MAAAHTWRAVAVAGLLTMTGTAIVQAPANSAPPRSKSDDKAATSAGSQGDAVGSTLWGDISTKGQRRALEGDGTWSPGDDLGSMAWLTASQGIEDLWRRGITGKDVTVAVIDTGIAPVAGLGGDGKLLNGPDLSFDGQTDAARYVDGFGHGTHLAGVIAGRDAEWDKRRPDPAVFAGVAPEAQLLNMRVGASDGGADVSQVIAALDWVVQHRDDDGMDVRVISLAYGTASPQPWQVDPLAHAVQNAWEAGIVVVTAAGNDGLAAPSLLMPALHPGVIAVGAFDPMGTPRAADDVVADFTSGGSADRRPDVVAPGRSLVSLRVPGSYADTFHPEGAVQGDTTGRYFRGSGTSQATAFVAGQVALLLDARPGLTPDQVKALLVATARPLPDGHPAMGAGLTDIASAVGAPTPGVAGTSASANGTGSLEASRGGEHVVDPMTGTVLTGEVDIMGTPWQAKSWARASSAGTTWRKGQWNGRTWTGDRFAKGGWKFSAWSGTSWSGVSWSAYDDSGPLWTGRSWRGDNWEGRSWREASWLGRSWRSLP